jgi:multicomponent Na+:H+ antiporter subunit D
METIGSIRPLLAILASVLVIPLIILSRGSPNLREIWTMVGAVLKFTIVVSMLPMALAGTRIEFTLAEVLPGFALQLRVDAPGMLFALVSSFLWIVTSLYSIGYMRGLHEHGQTRYYSFFALSLSATVGVAFSANLLTLYLFYELLTLSTYPLVTHHQDEQARSSGRKYLFFILGTSIGMILPAMLFIAHKTGTLEFTSQGIVAGRIGGQVTSFLVLIFVFGFAKAAVMPFHAWLPAAMVAPTPVSALLHAVAVVKVGVFSVFRMMTGIFGTGWLDDLGISTIICGVAALTIIVSSLIALSADGLKRRLAFSTIGQLSYIILGVALLSKSGMVGGLLHIAMHAFGKITLFFCAGAIFVATGVTSISEMVGIGRRLPLTMSAFFIGALSVIGLPPCGGFISKWHLALGTVESGQFLMLGILLVSSLLNAAYFLPIVYRAFFCSPSESMFAGPAAEAPTWCLVPPLLTALISIVLFFYPQPFLRLARLGVQVITGG